MRRAALVFAALAPLASAEAPQLWFKTPAAQWAEALPIGNGRLAAMVFGGIESERLQLNEETIYAGKQIDRVNPEARANIPVIRRMLLAGQVMPAQELAEKTVLAIPRRQPPYEPLGDLTVAFKGIDPAQVRNYRRCLDLYDGIAQIDFDVNDVHYSRTAFASYPDGVIVVHLKTSRPRVACLFGSFEPYARCSGSSLRRVRAEHRTFGRKSVAARPKTKSTMTSRKAVSHSQVQFVCSRTVPWLRAPTMIFKSNTARKRL